MKVLVVSGFGFHFLITLTKQAWKEKLEKKYILLKEKAS